MSRTINAERKALLTPIDSNDELVGSRQEMKQLVDYLSEKYTDDNGELDIVQAVMDMGLKIISGSPTNAITLTGVQTTTLAVAAEEYTPDFRTDLTRLLGVYLFTNEVDEEGYYDTTLTNEEEQKLNSFLLLVKIPELDFNEYFTIDKLIRLSIEFEVPLPILRSTLSI